MNPYSSSYVVSRGAARLLLPAKNKIASACQKRRPRNDKDFE